MDRDRGGTDDCGACKRDVMQCAHPSDIFLLLTCHLHLIGSDQNDRSDFW